MDSWLQKNLEFAKKGLESGKYIYTIELCKGILSKETNCIEARRLLQIANKTIYADVKTFFRIRRYVVSWVYLLSAFIFRKRNRLNFIQKAVWCCPTSKIAWILFAQVAFEQDIIELLIFAYEELHQLFPKDNRFGLALGNIYLNIGDYGKALKIGQVLLEKDTENADAIILVERAFLGKIEAKKDFDIHN